VTPIIELTRQREAGLKPVRSSCAFLDRLYQDRICQRASQQDVRAIYLQQHALFRSSQQMHFGARADTLRVERDTHRLADLTLQDVCLLAGIEIGDWHGDTSRQDTFRTWNWFALWVDRRVGQKRIQSIGDLIGCRVFKATCSLVRLIVVKAQFLDQEHLPKTVSAHDIVGIALPFFRQEANWESGTGAS
jgi:hypothetical protein